MRLLLLTLLSASVLAAEVKIEVTHPETCTRKTKVGDSITVNYRGTLTDGEVFDSSYGRAPFAFTLGKGQVIQGWDKGLLDMCIGEKRKLTIPPSLAYGSSRAIGSCNTDCTLLFETELMGIKGVKKETPPPPAEDKPEPAKEEKPEPPKEEKPEPAKEEKKVSTRQSGLDHMILFFAGLLILVSGGMAFLWIRRGRRAGKGLFGQDRYEMVGQRTA